MWSASVRPVYRVGKLKEIDPEASISVPGVMGVYGKGF